jgi:hypothetical protein
MSEDIGLSTDFSITLAGFKMAVNKMFAVVKTRADYTAAVRMAAGVVVLLIASFSENEKCYREGLDALMKDFLSTARLDLNKQYYGTITQAICDHRKAA